MDNFGDYITKQYGLSKKILKYLPLCDLLNARNVCRDWCKVVNVILKNDFDKAPQINFTENSSTKIEELEYWKNSHSIPKIVIKYFTSSSHKKRVSDEINDINLIWKPIFHPGEKGLGEEFYDVSPSLLHLRCVECFAYTNRVRDKPKEIYYSSWFDGASSTVGLPNINDVYYSVLNVVLKDYYNKNKKEYEFNLEEELNRDKEKGPVKCILIYENRVSRESLEGIEELLRHIFHRICKQQTAKFAFGGGKVRNLSWWEDNQQEIPDVCILIIRSEIVIAHSDILRETWSSKLLNQYFETFAKRTGPTPKGAFRMALMAQCVDRPFSYEEIESCSSAEAESIEINHFLKHFPNVSVSGFLAGGEYGFRASSCPTKVNDHVMSSKKARLNDDDDCDDNSLYSDSSKFMHFQSTSIVILTFLNVLK